MRMWRVTVVLVHLASASATDACDVTLWPDVKDATCGECKVLVNNFDTYPSCNYYCQAVNLGCVGAWEENADDCVVNTGIDMTCATTSQAIRSSDAICECGQVVNVVLTVTAVDYNKLEQDATLFLAFETAVKQALAGQAGADIDASHVGIVVSSGSVMLAATITPPVGVLVNRMMSASVSSAVAAKVQNVPNIGTAIDAGGSIGAQVNSLTGINQPTPSTSAPSSGGFSCANLPCRLPSDDDDHDVVVPLVVGVGGFFFLLIIGGVICKLTGSGIPQDPIAQPLTESREDPPKNAVEAPKGDVEAPGTTGREATASTEAPTESNAEDEAAAVLKVQAIQHGMDARSKVESAWTKGEESGALRDAAENTGQGTKSQEPTPAISHWQKPVATAVSPDDPVSQWQKSAGMNVAAALSEGPIPDVEVHGEDVTYDEWQISRIMKGQGCFCCAAP